MSLKKRLIFKSINRKENLKEDYTLMLVGLIMKVPKKSNSLLAVKTLLNQKNNSYL